MLLCRGLQPLLPPPVPATAAGRGFDTSAPCHLQWHDTQHIHVKHRLPSTLPACLLHPVCLLTQCLTQCTSEPMLTPHHCLSRQQYGSQPQPALTFVLQPLLLPLPLCDGAQQLPLLLDELLLRLPHLLGLCCCCLGRRLLRSTAGQRWGERRE